MSENKKKTKSREGKNGKLFEAIRHIRMMKRGKPVEEEAKDSGLPLKELWARRKQAIEKIKKYEAYNNIDDALAIYQVRIDEALDMLRPRLDRGNIAAINAYINASTKMTELFIKGQQAKTVVQSGGNATITIVPKFVDYKAVMNKPRTTEDFDGDPAKLEEEDEEDGD